MKRTVALLILLVVGLHRPFSQSKWDDTREIVLDTYEQPIPFKMEEKICVAYELHITNFGLDSLFIRSIKVFTDDSEVPFKTYSGEYLEKCLSRIKVPTSTGNDTIIHIGQRAILHAMLCFTSDRVPKNLLHQVEYNFINSDKSKGSIITRGGEININSEDKALVINSPFEEGIWQISNSVADGCFGHRQGAIRSYNGIPYQKQRCAIDFIRLDEKGEAVHGKFGENLNWFTYNSNVIAVADAYVIDIHDNDPECPPLIPDNERLAKITSLAGNYIILDLGNKMYAEYAHLKPGSLLVKKGDRVRKGQFLAKVGSSGNSTVPHLHFGINRNAPFKGESIPYVFNIYKYLGSSLADELKVEYAKLGKIEKDMLPKANSVVQFVESDSSDIASSVFLKRQEFLYIMNTQSVSSAVQYFNNLRKTNKDIMLFGEQGMNQIGYDYLDKGKIKDAIEIFRLNVIEFPNSGNAYDSLGEAYLKDGQKELAIENYKKSLELDPNNTYAKKILDELNKK